MQKAPCLTRLKPSLRVIQNLKFKIQSLRHQRTKSTSICIWPPALGTNPEPAARRSCSSRRRKLKRRRRNLAWTEIANPVFRIESRRGNTAPAKTLAGEKIHCRRKGKFSSAQTVSGFCLVAGVIGSWWHKLNQKFKIQNSKFKTWQEELLCANSCPC